MKILIFDIETTGLPPKGANYETDFNQFPHIVQIAWLFDGVMKDYIVKPTNYTIPDEVALIHGITTEIALEKGTPLNTIFIEFFKDCQQADKVVAHNIYFDTSIIKANVFRMGWTDAYVQVVEPSLSKEKRIDTMMKTIKFVGAKFADGRPNKFPTLLELYFKLFGEEFDAHNAVADVKAIERCLHELINLGIIQL